MIYLQLNITYGIESVFTHIIVLYVVNLKLCIDTPSKNGL